MKLKKIRKKRDKHISEYNEYFREPQYGNKKLDQISDIKQKYMRVYCKKCGHSLKMLPSTESMVCSWCGTRNINQSKGRFNYMMNKLLKREYKKVEVDE